MADPLSVAASVTGILAVSATVSLTVAELIKNVKKAPKEYQDLLVEVDSIQKILGQLQSFVLGAEPASPTRSSLILVEQVVTILSACVMTFSDLDVHITAIGTSTNPNILERFRLVSKSKSLGIILQKMQMHKDSLNLILTLLTCQSVQSAEACVTALCQKVEDTLKQNKELAKRLRASELEIPESDPSSTDPEIVSPSPETEAPSEKDNLGDEKEILPEPGSEMQAKVYGFAFEEDLISSRPYRKLKGENQDTFSILSAAGRTTSWSVLSGISLSRMSNIAILALPIYPRDIHNASMYAFDTSKSEGRASNTNAQEWIRKQSRVHKQRLLDMTTRIRTSLLTSEESSESSPIVTRTTGIMFVPLSTCVRTASATILLRRNDLEWSVRGYIPVLVAECGYFLKSKALDTVDLFAAAGHPLRVLRLERIFTTEPSYGRRFNWTGSTFTQHDCATLLLGFLKTLPEPVIPHVHYELMVSFLKDCRDPSNDGDIHLEFLMHEDAIWHLQFVVSELPAVNRCLFLYLLHLLGKVAENAHINYMTASRLVAAFQPSLLSREPSEMTKAEFNLAKAALVFMVDNYEHFSMGLLESIDSVTATEQEKEMPEWKNGQVVTAVRRTWGKPSALTPDVEIKSPYEEQWKEEVLEKELAAALAASELHDGKVVEVQKT